MLNFDCGVIYFIVVVFVSTDEEDDNKDFYDLFNKNNYLQYVEVESFVNFCQ